MASSLVHPQPSLPLPAPQPPFPTYPFTFFQPQPHWPTPPFIPITQWPVPLYHPLHFPNHPPQPSHPDNCQNTTKPNTVVKPQTNSTHSNAQTIPPIPTPPRHSLNYSPKSTGVKHTFRIDAKTFTLFFNGGRNDSYYIIEHRGNFRGSIWVSVKSLHWLLDARDKLHQITDQPEGFFRSHKDGYKILEISRMKNKGGRFVEFSDYHSGSQQGHIRIPKGKQGRGWVSFARELRQFFLGGGVKPTKAAGSVLVKDEVVAVNLGQNLGHKSCSSITTVSRELGGDFIKSARFTHNGRRSVFECLDLSQLKST